MAIGERIKRIRNLRKLTQSELGAAIGFAENTADVRIAQYESGKRTPKEKYIEHIADVLNVGPQSLAVPDIDSYIGVFQILFTLEDLYGIKINNLDGEYCITLDKYNDPPYHSMFAFFRAWHEQAEKLKSDEITQEQYDDWRYNYPGSDTSGRWVKIPSKELSDALIKNIDIPEE